MSNYNVSVLALVGARSSRGGGGGSGGSHVQRGGEGRTRVTYFAEEWVFLKTSAYPRFSKRRVLFCTKIRSMGGGGGGGGVKIRHLAIHEINADFGKGIFLRPPHVCDL